ncbi:hypothetical protein HNP38_003516 [Chryseobacterium defluvii]|uniref:Uncharacterized protein n=1 Tax=Chryseobacterium defluvii TaxID=160396 RepID=A0A840KG78_9FLAO|nr:hypothetical protein [Chryseobacterium defluvii]MBB4808176.1 hypothetical protein [Chryseobacterium defluvii]
MYPETTDLNHLIKSSLQIKNEKHKEKEVTDEDNLWNTSLFLSNVLYKASSYNFSFTKSDFKSFKINFEQTEGIKIDETSLFGRYWLREVLEQINF